MSGTVDVDPAVIDEIVRLCDVMLAELEKCAETAGKLSSTEGFGDFDSARQLAAGFARKAQGTPESAVERVDQFIEALTRLREAFASGGAAFREAEWEWARRLAAAAETA